MTDVRDQRRGPPEWASDYVGLPFAERGRDRDGCDCWGLVRLVLGERFGVAVPSYAEDYETTKDHERLGDLIAAGKSEDWMEVFRPSAPAAQPLMPDPCHLSSEPGDVLLLRMSGLPIHVGILVTPGWMLHTRESTGSVLERFSGLAWERRVLGIYRHAPGEGAGSDVRNQKGEACAIGI